MITEAGCPHGQPAFCMTKKNCRVCDSSQKLRLLLFFMYTVFVSEYRRCYFCLVVPCLGMFFARSL